MSKDVNVYIEDNSGKYKIDNKTYKKMSDTQNSSREASTFYCQGSFCCNAEVTLSIDESGNVSFIVNCGCNSYCTISQGPSQT